MVYSTAVAYLLWFIGGFGTLGIHRFYLGKFGTGVLFLLTGGLCWLGSIYDFFTLGSQVRERNLESRYRRVLEHGEERPIGPQITREFRKDSIEKVILRTARKNGGIATPSEVALEGDVALDDAKKHLERLLSNGFAEVRVNKKGTVVYTFPDFLTDETEQALEDI